MRKSFIMLSISIMLTILCMFSGIAKAQSAMDELVDTARQHELRYYNYIHSDKALAPTWFKQSVKLSLDGTSIERDTWRRSPFISIYQCTILFRLCVLFWILYPVFVKYNPNRYDYNGFFALFVGEVVAIPIFYLIAAFSAWILNLLIYVVSGTDKNIPTEFVLFLLLLLFVFFMVYSLTRRYFSWIQKKQNNINKVLGFTAVFISWAGTLFTIKDIFIYLARLFGLNISF